MANLIPEKKEQSSNSYLIPEVIENEVASGAHTDDYKKRMSNLSQIAVKGNNQDLERYVNNLTMNGNTEGAREEVSAFDFIQREAVKKRELVEQIANPDVQADFVAKQMLDISELSKSQIAMERLAIEKFSNPISPVAQELGGKNIDLQDKIKVEALNRMMWGNIIGNEMKLQENESIVSDTLDLAGHLVGKEALDWMNIDGDAMNTIRENIRRIDELPEEERYQAAQELVRQLKDQQSLWENPAYAAGVLNQAVFGTEFDDNATTLGLMMEGLVGAGDAAALLKTGVKGLALRKAADIETISADPILKSLNQSKAVVMDDATTGLAAMANMTGNADELIKQGLKDLDQNNVFSSIEDQVGVMLPTKPTSETGFTFSGSVDKMLRSQQTELNRIVNNSLSPAYTEEFIQKALNEVELDKPIREFLDMSVDDSGNIIAKLGDREGQRFIDKESAEMYLEQLDSKFMKVKEHSAGGWVLEGKWTYSDAGFSDEVLGTRGFNNIDNIINNTLLSAGRLAEASHNATMEAASSVIKKGITKGLKGGNPVITKRNRAVFEQISQKYMREKKWATDSEFATDWLRLRGKRVTQGQLAAYHSMKQLDEMAYQLDNTTIYRSELSRGYGTYDIGDGFSIDVDRINGKAEDISKITNESGDLTSHITIFQETNTTRARTANPLEMSKLDLEKLNETHQLVRISDKSGASFFGSLGSKQTKYVYIPKNIKQRALDDRQLAKAGGGRGGYSHPHYVKVARREIYDDGSTARIHDLTIAASDTMNQGADYAHKLTEAFKILKARQTEEITTEVADQQIRKLGLFDGAVSFQKADDVLAWGVKKRIITSEGKDIPVIQAVRDGDSVVTDSSGFIADLGEDVRTTYQGRSFSKHRSQEEMYHVDGKKAEILDPIDAIVRNLERSSSMAGWAPFKARSLDFMKKRYGNYLQDVSHPIDYLTVEVKANTPAAIEAEIKNHQTWLKDLIGYKTNYQEGFARTAEDMIDKTFDKIPQLEKAGNWMTATMNKAWLGDLSTKRSNVRSSLIQKAAQDPFVRVKSAVFNMKLGLFNPASFIMQFVQSVNIMAITGKEGMQAGSTGLLGRIAMNMDDEAIEAMAKKVGIKELGFDSPDDFIEYVREFKTHGFNYMDKSIAYIDGVAGAQTGSSLAGNLADRGRFFFNEGERGSRLTAYGAARREWKNSKKGVNPKGLSATSDEGRKYIQDRTHTLMLGMTKADLQLSFRAREGAGAFNNAIPLMTQFWSYPFRAIGVMFGKNLTKQEKWRLGLANFAMFGSAGIPLVDTVSGWLDNKYGDKVDKGLSKLLTNGMLDALMFEAFEADTAFGQRGGIGHFVSTLTTDVFEKDFIDFITGAGGSTSMGVIDAFQDGFRAYGAYNGNVVEGFSEAAMAATIEQISSLNNTTKFLYALHAGEVLDRNKRKYFNVTKTEAFLNLVGVPFEKYQTMNDLMTSEKKRREFIKDATEDFLTIQAELASAYEDKDEEKVAHFQERLAFMGEAIREKSPLIWRDVRSSVVRNQMGRNTFDRMFSTSMRRYVIGDDYFTPKGAVSRELERKQLELKQEGEQ